jgi:hypothetical protein
MVQWRQRAEEEERGAPQGGVLLLKVAQGGGRGRRKRWARRWAGAVDKAVGGQGGGRGSNAVDTATPLFGPCG